MTVTVTVKEQTTVYSGSEDEAIATVSPFEQQIQSNKGGKLTFTITPKTVKLTSTLVCFLDSQFEFTCVTVTIESLTIKFITKGTTWKIPADWNDKSNQIEAIGGGGGGPNGSGGGGA